MIEEPKPPRDDKPLADDQTKKSPAQPEPRKATDRLEPTRYGDWEKDGRCIDF